MHLGLAGWYSQGDQWAWRRLTPPAPSFSFVTPAATLPAWLAVMPELPPCIGEALMSRLLLGYLQEHPGWALVMGIEHERIHTETTSVLLREHPLRLLS